MVNVTVELYGISDIAAVVKTVQHRVMNLRPSWFGVRDVILQGTRERFNKQGELDGSSWMPLHPMTIFMRGQRGGGGSQILNETGKLKKIFDKGNVANLGFMNFRTMMKLTVNDNLSRNGASLAAIQQWTDVSGTMYRQQQITQKMRWYLASMGVDLPKDKTYLIHPNRRFFMIENKDKARIGVTLLHYLTMGFPVSEKAFLITGIAGADKRLVIGRNMTMNQKFGYWQTRERSRYATVEGKMRTKVSGWKKI